MTRRVMAFAKLNLSLAVRFRRPDGFHEIESLVQTIDLADSLEIDVAPGDAIDVRNSLRDIQGPDLAMQAASALLEAKSVRRRVSIRIVKGIPAGAGLGGGSSDGAAVLAELDRLTPPQLAPAKLHEIAAAIGSDVPLFLLGGRMHVGGRGERLRRLPDASPEHYVVIVPPVHCPTADVYAAWTAPSRQAIADLALGRNDLLAPALSVRPTLRRYRDAVMAYAASYAGMSGSGSSFYAAFDGAASAARCAEDLRRALPDCAVYACRPTDVGSTELGAEEG
jgi:4-diphosphocytidyl-2-C-methyl-D-erythritol kinase